MMRSPDHIIFCISQPSLSARDERTLLNDLREAASAADCPVQAIRLEGAGPSLSDALSTARDLGARRVMVQPIAFPMAANLMAWLPGAISYWQSTEGPDVRVWLGESPDSAEVLPALIRSALERSSLPDDHPVGPSLGKRGWQYLPDHDTHILVCTGPRCAFRGAGTLSARLKDMLAQEGLSDRCLTTTTGCLFPCNQGPLVVLYPRNHWYIVPDELALHRLVVEAIAKGDDVSDLRLATRPQLQTAS